MTRAKQFLAAGLIGVAAIACGDDGVKMAGETLEDAGQQLMQMSGRMMVDAGRGVQDAGDGRAHAQNDGWSCDCEGDLPLRTITADTDPAQLETSVQYTADDVISGPQGPFVVTAAGGEAMSIKDSGDCTVGGARISGSGSFENGRVFIPIGKVLCFWRLNGDQPRHVHWSGFRPYGS